MTALNEEQREDIKEIVADILDIDFDELDLTSLFKEDYDADSLRSIEILAVLEKQYGVKIPQEQLGEMVNLQAIYDVVDRNLLAAA